MVVENPNVFTWKFFTSGYEQTRLKFLDSSKSVKLAMTFCPLDQDESWWNLQSQVSCCHSFNQICWIHPDLVLKSLLKCFYYPDLVILDLLKYFDHNRLTMLMSLDMFWTWLESKILIGVEKKHVAINFIFFKKNCRIGSLLKLFNQCSHF